MNAHQRYMQHRKDELYHFNPNHDPRNGQFTSGKGISGVIKNIKQKFQGHKDAHQLHEEARKLVERDDYYDNPDFEKQVAKHLREANEINSKRNRNGPPENRTDARMEGKHLLVASKRMFTSAAEHAKEMLSDPQNITSEQIDQYNKDRKLAENTKREAEALLKYTTDLPDRPYYNQELEQTVEQQYKSANPDAVHEQFMRVLNNSSPEEHSIKNSIATGGFRITKGDVHDASNKLLAIYKREKIDPRTPGIRAFNDADRINRELKKKCSSGLSNISKETPENKAAIEKAYASSTNVGSLAKDLYQKIQRDSQYSRTDSLGKQYTEKQKTFDEDVKELGRLIRDYDDAYFKEFGKRLMIV